MRSIRDTALLTLALSAVAVPTAVACNRPPKTPKPTTPCPTTPVATTPTTTTTTGGVVTLAGPKKHSRHHGHGSKARKAGYGGHHGSSCVPATTPPVVTPTTPAATTPPATTPATTPLPPVPTTPDTTPVDEGPGTT